MRSRLTLEEGLSLVFLGALLLAAAIWGAFIAKARGQDFDRGLDLPIERPAPVASRSAAGAVIGSHVPTGGRVLEPPPPPTPTDTEERPPTFFGQEIKSAHTTIFYVVDISGSMAGDYAAYLDEDGAPRTGNRLERAKVELAKSIATLPGHFRFDVLAYDCSSIQWQPALTQADPGNKASCIAWVRALQPGGGTGTGWAVALALRARTEAVILLTDGAPNCRLDGLSGTEYDMERHRAVIREANTLPAVVNVFAIGATGKMRAFCEHVAQDNGGMLTEVR